MEMQGSLLPIGGKTVAGWWVGTIELGPCNSSLFRLGEVGSAQKCPPDW